MVGRFGIVCVTLCLVAGCGVVNLGKWKGIEFPGRGEKFYLAKEVFLTPGSAYGPKESFDHAMNESINLFVIPRNEKNHYILTSIWYDPSGVEFRKIRTTHDLNEEGKKDIQRTKGGTTRIHSLPTKMLADHKVGMWNVAVYLDDELVRKLNFYVR